MPNQGLVPIDPTTPVGQVRLLLGDTDPTGVTGGKGEYIFYSDAELAALIGLHGDSVKRTAARILRSAAFSQAILLKKWTSADVAVDGPAVARELRLQADALDKQADDEEAALAGGAFAISDGMGGTYVGFGEPYTDDLGVPHYPYGISVY